MRVLLYLYVLLICLRRDSLSIHLRVYVEKIKETFETPFMILDEIVKEKPEYLKIAENDGELSREFMDYYKNPRNWENQIICF